MSRTESQEGLASVWRGMTSIGHAREMVGGVGGVGCHLIDGITDCLLGTHEGQQQRLGSLTQWLGGA